MTRNDTRENGLERGAQRAQLLADGFERALAAASRANADYAQATMWLVGIAASLLALLVSQLDRFKALLDRNLHIFVWLLLTTVIAGTLFRLVQIWVNQEFDKIAIRLVSYLTGYAGGAAAQPPKLLSATWTQEEIVRQIEENFGQNYDFLLTYKAPIERCQEIYKQMLDGDSQAERETIEHLAQVICAHLGISRERLARIENSGPPTARALNLGRIRGAGMALYATSSLTFVAALTILAKALVALQ